MVTAPTTQNIIRSFTLPPTGLASRTATAQDPGASSFEAQLSGALAESLQKLGLSTSEIQINVRNGATPSSRQIVITWGDPTGAGAGAGTAAGATPPASTPATGSPGLNPFNINNTPPVGSGSPTVRTPPPSATSWSPWAGPCDPRDAIPANGGLLTASGGPDIRLNTEPTKNQYNYSGPASQNPYFTNPGNPLRDGYVLGFGNWFQNATIFGMKNGPVTANPIYFSSDDGAKEALRLVQMHEPGAQITQKAWGGGPFTSDKQMYQIALPNGRSLNAGGVLWGYYNNGQGVNASSDTELQKTIVGTA